MKRVLVIGNGFDLDMGFDTTYETFARSYFKKNIYEYSKMFLFLRKRYEECPNKNRFNFEDEIYRYVSSLGDDVSEKDVAADRTYYNALCHDLMCSLQIFAFSVPYANTPEYVRENDGNRHEVNPAYLLRGKSQSIASRMLDFISINPTYFDSIISFNYTNLGNLLLLRVAGNVNYNQQDIEFFKKKIMNRVHYVHLRKEESGRSFSVLGINEEKSINDGYNFVRKRYQAIRDERERAISDISYAEELIIFGHSLGDSDKEYFQPFFRDLYNERNIDSDDKDVTFITYDDNRSIIERLNILADTNVIYNHNFVNHTHFIYTKVEESHICYMDLVNHLHDSSL